MTLDGTVRRHVRVLRAGLSVCAVLQDADEASRYVLGVSAGLADAGVPVHRIRLSGRLSPEDSLRSLVARAARRCGVGGPHVLWGSSAGPAGIEDAVMAAAAAMSSRIGGVPRPVVVVEGMSPRVAGLRIRVDEGRSVASAGGCLRVGPA